MNSIREDLKAFVDGELSPERMQEVQAAVDADSALQKEVAFMKAVGEEIKQIASEPEVAGREAALSKFRKPLAPWWDPSRLSGRLAYTAGLFLVLAGVSAVLFPVFAQSKASAKKAAEISRMKNQAVADSATGSAGGETGLSLPEPTGGFASQAPSRERADSEGTFGNNPSAASPDRFGGKALPSEDAGLDKDILEGNVYAETEVPATMAPSAGGAGVASSRTPQAARKTSRPEPRVSNRDDAKKPTFADAPATNRMVVKNANIDLKVEDAKKTLTEAENLAKSLGGYVEGGTMTAPEGQAPRAAATLRVPARLYETAMQALRGMGEVLGENTNAQDVTAAHADVQARMRVLRAEEESYVSMLRAARRVGEIMEIKDRLSQIRQQIESYDAQRKALANEAALSTIHATFTEKAKVEEEKKKDEGGFDETWAKAQNGLSKVGEFLGNLSIYLLVFSPVWLPPVLLFWWLSRRAKA